VGFAAAVGDAEGSVTHAADYVAGRPGGNGAVRDIAEFILRARGSWEAVTAEWLGSRDDT
jgi:3-deoxy-D-manno-octulosonate 8-phosphate phosphatase (KDO 8-P phosphatase)